MVSITGKARAIDAIHHQRTDTQVRQQRSARGDAQVPRQPVVRRAEAAAAVALAQLVQQLAGACAQCGQNASILRTDSACLRRRTKQGHGQVAEMGDYLDKLGGGEDVGPRLLPGKLGAGSLVAVAKKLGIVHGHKHVGIRVCRTAGKRKRHA